MTLIEHLSQHRADVLTEINWKLARAAIGSVNLAKSKELATAGKSVVKKHMAGAARKLSSLSGAKTSDVKKVLSKAGPKLIDQAQSKITPEVARQAKRSLYKHARNMNALSFGTLARKTPNVSGKDVGEIKKILKTKGGPDGAQLANKAKEMMGSK